MYPSLFVIVSAGQTWEFGLHDQARPGLGLWCHPRNSLFTSKRLWLCLVGFRSSFRFFPGAKCLQIVHNLTRAIPYSGGTIALPASFNSLGDIPSGPVDFLVFNADFLVFNAIFWFSIFWFSTLYSLSYMKYYQKTTKTKQNKTKQNKRSRGPSNKEQAEEVKRCEDLQNRLDGNDPAKSWWVVNL